MASRYELLQFFLDFEFANECRMSDFQLQSRQCDRYSAKSAVKTHHRLAFWRLEQDQRHLLLQVPHDNTSEDWQFHAVIALAVLREQCGSQTLSG
jgi:hypothetical protein